MPVDIGMGGACIELPVALDEGDPLFIVWETANGSIMKIWGEVRWCNSNRKGDKWRVGIRFKDVNTIRKNDSL
jgi:hypothetical protein